MNRSDKIFITIVIILTIGLYVSSQAIINLMAGDELQVVVYYKDKEFARYDIRQDGLFTVPGELGDIQFEINDERVRVVEETSPLNICSSEGLFGGWKSKPNDPIVCLPNQTYIMIESSVDQIDNPDDEDFITQ